MAFDPNAIRSGALVSTNPTYLGAWVAYINGRFVPIMGFDTDTSVWAIPTFRVHLLPDAVITRLGAEDRVQVALFYLDHWYDAEKPEMRLLCDGEIVGWGYSHSGGARSIAFTCAAHLSIFQALYFHYMTNVDDIVASRAPEVQATSVATTAGPIYPYGLFHQGLTPTAAQLAAESPGSTADAPAPEGAPSPSTPIQSAYELVTNAIRGCISKDVPDTRRALPAMNFVGRWIRLTNFHNRWVRMPLLEDPDRLASRVGVFPIFNAVRNAEALTAMQRHVASQVGNAGNIWNLFQQVLGLVYMEIGAIPNPCTVLVQLNDTSGGAGSNPVDGRIIGHPDYGTPQVDQRSAEARAAGAGSATPGISPRTPVRLAQYFVKPQMLTGEVPACNAIFPSQIESWAFDENYAGQPTRVYINDSVMTQALRAEGPNREFMLHALTAAWPEEAHAILHHRAGSTTDAAAGPTESGKNLLIWPEEYYKGVVASRAALPAWFQMLRQFANAQAVQPPVGAPASGEAPAQVGRPVNTAPDAAVVASLTGLGAPVTVLDAGAAARRGRTPPQAPRPEESPDYPYRWIAPEATLAKGRTQNTAYTTVKRVASVRNPRTEQAVDDVEPLPGTKALRAFLYRQFPNVFSPRVGPDGVNRTIGLVRPQARRTPIAIGRNIDDHRAGMALDLTIAPIHGRPHLEVGAPVANWLVENAQALGIAYLVYGRSIWAGGDSFGRRMGGSPARFRHYTVPGAAMDHFDHIHVTLVRDVAMGYGGVLGRNNPLPAPSTAPLTVVRRPAATPSAIGAPGTGTETTPSTTTSAGTAATTPGTNAEGDAFAELFSLYTQYEYERQRAAQRTASAQLAFNPYLVVGFPAMLFDSMSVGVHVVGYVQRVGHSGMISPSGARLATTTQLSYARTFYEFLAAVKSDAQRFAARITSAPADAIREIREVTQDESQAEVFYSRLLHGGRSLGGFEIQNATNGVRAGQRRACLRWTDVMGYATAGGRTEEIVIEGASVAAVVQQERGDIASPTTPAPAGTPPAVSAPTEAPAAVRTGTEGIDLSRELSPRENGYAEAFVSYDVAMRYAARPCCTLDEYVMFWHGGASIPELQRNGQVGAVRTDFCYASENVPDVLKMVPNDHGGTDFVRGERTRLPAAYYERIYKLRPGPGPEPTPTQRGYETEPAITPTATTEGLPADYPQTRSDWDAVLDFYVEKVMNRNTPSR